MVTILHFQYACQWRYMIGDHVIYATMVLCLKKINNMEKIQQHETF